VVLPDKFRQNSLFDPKDLLHEKTASSLMANILKDVFDCDLKTLKSKRAASCPVGGPTIVVGLSSFSVGLSAGGGCPGKLWPASPWNVPPFVLI
jgi:hypothetical protein